MSAATANADTTAHFATTAARIRKVIMLRLPREEKRV
jgi:hypothetical protein